ncbi:hypothetical protein [Mesorhizobium sp. WSM3862]|uniref:hypothetical protein n=1 Tax=Mesorhizobium sp. WSM3862 TaxID=632858 RepID=UPI001140AA66|nr:hypothetical protein [Mesorhizobium sp. WSM3862]
MALNIFLGRSRCPGDAGLNKFERIDGVRKPDPQDEPPCGSVTFVPCAIRPASSKPESEWER